MSRLLPVLLIMTAVLPLIGEEDPYQDQDQRPMLGVQMSPVPTRVLQQQNLTPEQGVYVRRVYGGTAAGELGLKRGDVIVEINGSDINSMGDLRNEVMDSDVGDPVQLVVRRDGENLRLGGATYQPWPEDIPFSALDRRAEDRYRQAQMRYLSRRQDRIANLSQAEETLSQEVAALRRHHEDAAAGEPRPAGMDFSGNPRIAGVRLPEWVAAAPSWRFAFGTAVSAPTHNDATAEVSASPAAATAPELALGYTMQVTTRANDGAL